MNEKIAGRPPCYFFMPVTKDNVLYSSYFNWHNSIEYSTIPLYLKYKLWMGIKVYRSCFQRVAGWCEAIEVVRWHSPVSFGGECSSSHRRWFRYTRNESQLGWYRVMNITPLWATTVVLRGFFYCKSLVKLLIWCICVGISWNSIEIGGFTKLSQWIDIIQCYVLLV